MIDARGSVIRVANRTIFFKTTPIASGQVIVESPEFVSFVADNLEDARTGIRQMFCGLWGNSASD